jgi:hypothetical protein
MRWLPVGKPERSARSDERARIALHLDLLAEQLRGSLAAHRAIAELAERVRRNTLPEILIDEPGPDVLKVIDPHGAVVQRGKTGWIWYGGKSGRRPERPWEEVRDGFGPLRLPPLPPPDGWSLKPKARDELERRGLLPGESAAGDASA